MYAITLKIVNVNSNKLAVVPMVVASRLKQKQLE
jgi:hypothetical protein